MIAFALLSRARTHAHQAYRCTAFGRARSHMAVYRQDGEQAIARACNQACKQASKQASHARLL
eukprot:10932234-Alexandrium_andersonii.AAC.1